MNMFRLRFTSDCHARTKNGHPAHSTTGVASSKLDPGREPGWRRARAGRGRECGRPSQARTRHRQHETDPEPAGHVDELEVRPGLGRHYRPAPAPCRRSGSSGSLLPNLRVHRAGVDRALHGRRRRGLLRRPILPRIGNELLLAARRAEVERVALMVRPVLRRRGIHQHPTHWVFHSGPFIGRRASVCLLVMEVVVRCGFRSWQASRMACVKYPTGV